MTDPSTFSFGMALLELRSRSILVVRRPPGPCAAEASHLIWRNYRAGGFYTGWGQPGPSPEAPSLRGREEGPAAEVDGRRIRTDVRACRIRNLTNLSARCISMI